MLNSSAPYNVARVNDHTFGFIYYILYNIDNIYLTIYKVVEISKNKC